MNPVPLTRGVFIFEGILFTLLGILAIAIPVATTFAINFIVGVLLFIGGIVQGYRTFQLHRENGFYLSLLSAILNIVLGIILVLFPTIGVLSLTIVLIFFFMLQGMAKTIIAFQLRPMKNWGWLLFSGIISLVLSVIILAGFPQASFWVMGLLLGINMLIFGIAFLFLGLSLPKSDINEINRSLHMR